MKRTTKVEQVLRWEVDNADTVHLYLEEDGWCAYERSAYYLAKMKAPVSLRKEIVREGYDVVLLKALFPLNDLKLPLSSTAQLTLVADDRLWFEVKEQTGDDFSQWKEKQLRYLSA